MGRTRGGGLMVQSSAWAGAKVIAHGLTVARLGPRSPLGRRSHPFLGMKSVYVVAKITLRS